MSWRLAKCLIKLREQLDAAHPQRSKASDGSIGDAAHSARVSQHNPDQNGVVRAIDITHDPANGVDGHVLSRQLVTDSRTYYVIFAGEIWKSRTGKWEAYRGPNGHFHHVHISVVGDAHDYDDTAPWALGDVPAVQPGAVAPVRRTLKFGDEGPDVIELQAKLGIKADGKFGNHTLFALREYQAFHHLETDGIAGSKVYAVMFSKT